MATKTVLTGIDPELYLALDLPTIPGLLSLEWFGSGYDAINTNRVVGGPALSALGAPVAYAANAVKLGMNGTHATATPVVTDGQVVSYTITAGGSGYVAAPQINILGGGTGAIGTGVVVNGELIGITPVELGSGYVQGTTSVTVRGGNMAALNLGIERSADLLTSGWSFGCVARVPSTGQASVLVGNGTTGLNPANQMIMQNSNAFIGNVPTLELLTTGGSSSPRIRVLMSTPATNYHFVGATYSGGATGTWNLYNLTDDQQGTPWVASSMTANVATWHYGPNGTANAVEGLFSPQFEMPMGFFAGSVLSLSDFETLYASVRSIVARRGVTC